jgi:hypothetical protein
MNKITVFVDVRTYVGMYVCLNNVRSVNKYTHTHTLSRYLTLGYNMTQSY